MGTEQSIVLVYTVIISFCLYYHRDVIYLKMILIYHQHLLDVIVTVPVLLFTSIIVYYSQHDAH